MRSDVKQANIVNVRFNDISLEKLDTLVRECGYKSRSDCIKSLIEERYANRNIMSIEKGRFLELLKSDEDVREALQEMTQKTIKTTIENIMNMNVHL